eukprot:TRINITY_DN14859_c0_g1_i2.p2 TRINITY_DN14859_c0_g1~~TRINITY_DN14859_c0_g1_i2.p2  ORF type:complete len:113 (-),score=13.47 TRINITY_DN14859_c0_g1_i2:42-380(-)
MKNKCSYWAAEQEAAGCDCWSSKSDVPTEASESNYQTATDSDMESFYQEEFEIKHNQKQQPRRRRTFTFSSVTSILDKVCKIQPDQENCLMSETGLSVMQSIQFQGTSCLLC